MKKSVILMALSILLPGLPGVAQNPAFQPPEMVVVEGGSFMMGNDTGREDEKPAHKVTVGTFSIGKYEVTVADFKHFMEASGYVTDAELPDSVRTSKGYPAMSMKTGTWSRYPNGIPVSTVDSLYPVGNISWNDAVAYCNWLSKTTGKTFRLPTEAEWEFAAKGGVKSKGFLYSGGNDLGAVGWYLVNSRNKPHFVGEKTPNELGLYDMTGNAREWCSDWYGQEWYRETPAKNPTGPVRGTERVLRGGYWGAFDAYMPVTVRDHAPPYFNAFNTGFRVVLSPETTAKKTQ